MQRLRITRLTEQQEAAETNLNSRTRSGCGRTIEAIGRRERLQESQHSKMQRDPVRFAEAVGVCICNSTNVDEIWNSFKGVVANRSDDGRGWLSAQI